MNIVRLQGDFEKRNGLYYEYDVDSQPLGEGGMGRVFKGYRVVERTGERTPVAIKAIYDNIPERVVERARREAEIQLDNDNLIRMYGFVETVSLFEGGTKSKVHYHVIMELLVGVTLDDIIKGVTIDSNGMLIPFAAEIHNQYLQNRDIAVVRIMKSILSGLMALHDKGYIHRDIDPSNVMVTIDGKIKLIDFGICKQIISLESLDKALTATGVFMGKVNYAAPELVLGDVKSQNYTTDIYALGVLMYQLYTGHLPFNGTDQDILAANLRKPLPMRDVKNNDFRRIIRKATEKLQSKRYASVAEFRVDLDKVSMNKHGIDYAIILKISIAVLIGAFALIAIFKLVESIELTKTTDEPELLNDATTDVITCEDLYNNAMLLVNQGDSAHLQSQGKEQLRILAEDSLYQPAQMKYCLMLIYSKMPEDVKRGYTEFKLMTETDTFNSIALFECGLTLSQGNRYFEEPTIRQAMIGIKPDIEKANDLLYKSINIDNSDYKSVYWAMNNLIEKYYHAGIPQTEVTHLRELLRMFEERVEKFNDSTASKYKNAIADDVKLLKSWGIY